MKFVCGLIVGVALTASVDLSGQARWFYQAKDMLGTQGSQQLAYAVGAYDMLSFVLETHNAQPTTDWWPLLSKKYECLGTAATTAGALQAKASYLYKRGVDDGRGNESAASVLLTDACR